MTVGKRNFFDIIVKPTKVQSQTGYINDVDAERWTLRDLTINFDLLAGHITNNFLDEIKRQFAALVNAHGHADASIAVYFSALKDCLQFAYRGTGVEVDALTNEMIAQWRNEASGASYPSTLKHFIIAARIRDPKAFPKVSDKILMSLKQPVVEDQYILTLDPKNGPWLEREVLDQDHAIEQAYTSGAWHVEKFVFVQLFRLYGMRPEQLANMKIEDVRCRLTGQMKNEIRWPYAKNDLSTSQAPWWPLGGSLLPAMESYLKLRLDGIPPKEQERLPLFTPEGLPGVYRNVKEITKINKDQGYEGHAMASTISARFTRILTSLGLKTFRSGQPEPMNFNARRERHTIGTRLALKGYSAQQIALRLSHKRPASCTAYVDLARMAMQIRNPKFFHLMDKVGSAFTNPVVGRTVIERDLMPVISIEGTTVVEIALIGGGSCGNCMFAGDASAGEPWPCLSCPRFQLYEDADLQPLWEILQERKAFMQHEDGTWNNRFDPDIQAQFDRYQALLIGAEKRRREVVAKRAVVAQGEAR